MQLLWVQSLGQEDSLEKEMITHSHIHAWNIWTEEPGRLQSMGSQRVGLDLMTKQQQQHFTGHCEELLKVRREAIESYWRDLRRKATRSDLNFNRIPPPPTSISILQWKRPVRKQWNKWRGHWKNAGKKMIIGKTKGKAEKLHLKYTVLWRKSWESASILDTGCKRKWGGWCYIFWPEQWEERSCHLLRKFTRWAN